MTLIGLFGVNCSGKDTIIEKTIQLGYNLTFIRTSKILMKALGYHADPLSKETPAREWYLNLEQLPKEKMEDLTNNYLPNHLKTLKTLDTNLIATFHIALLKYDNKGNFCLYEEPIRNWYKEVFDGVIYLKSNINSVWERRQSDERNRGAFSYDEVGLQIKKSDEQWNEMCLQEFEGNIPYAVLRNNNSEIKDLKDESIINTSKSLIDFINSV